MLVLSACAATLHAQTDQGGITFKVEELPKPEKTLSTESARDIYEKLIREANDDDRYSFGMSANEKTDYPYGIVAQSKIDTPLVNLGYHPFFEGIRTAYAEHRPFVFSPDMVWLLISQGFAQHVKANAERLRGRFVKFDGKVSLVVSTTNDMLNNPDAPWSEVFPDFTKQIGAHTGDELIKTLTADFSTTTPAESIASQITIMDGMKPYFSYIMLAVSCGIPEITLKGTPEDWQRVLDKTKRLADYDLAWWTSELEPVLREFVKASRGEIDSEFWKAMFKLHKSKQCAPDIIDGWIVKFFPYDNVGARNTLKQLASTDVLPDEIVKVDVQYIDITKTPAITTPLEFWSGFVGLEQNEKTYTLTPKIGWMIRKKDAEKEPHEQSNDTQKTQSGDDWITFGVRTTVPAALFSLGKVNNLELIFADKISVPDELAQVVTKRLRLRGMRIDDEEREHIKKLFPNIEVSIDLYQPAKTNKQPPMPRRHE